MTTTIFPVVGGNVRYWWIFLLRGLLFIIAGVLTFRYPLESYVTLSVFFGVTIKKESTDHYQIVISRIFSKIYSGIFINSPFKPAMMLLVWTNFFAEREFL